MRRIRCTAKFTILISTLLSSLPINAAEIWQNSYSVENHVKDYIFESPVFEARGHLYGIRCEAKHKSRSGELFYSITLRGWRDGEYIWQSSPIEWEDSYWSMQDGACFFFPPGDSYHSMKWATEDQSIKLECKLCATCYFSFLTPFRFKMALSMARGVSHGRVSHTISDYRSVASSSKSIEEIINETGPYSLMVNSPYENNIVVVAQGKYQDSWYDFSEFMIRGGGNHGTTLYPSMHFSQVKLIVYESGGSLRKPRRIGKPLTSVIVTNKTATIDLPLRHRMKSKNVGHFPKEKKSFKQKVKDYLN